MFLMATNCTVIKWAKPPRRRSILVPLVSLILGALIKESIQLRAQQAECLRKCRLDQREVFKTGEKVLN